MRLPSYELPEAGSRPPLAYPAYRSTQLRAPMNAPVHLPQRLTEVTGPLLGCRPGPARRQRPDQAARRRAHWPANHRARSRTRLGRAPGPGHAAGDLAGKRRRALRAPLGPLAGAIGPELLRRRALRDRCRRALLVRHDQAGAVPVGQPPQRLAPGAHPLLAARRAVLAAAGRAICFPGDPLFPYDPIFNSVRDPKVRERLIAGFSIARSQDNWALAYEFDIVLRGPDETPIEEEH